MSIFTRLSRHCPLWKSSTVLLALACALVAQASAQPALARQHIRFDAGWRLHIGDLPWPGGEQVTGWRAKIEPRGAAAAADCTGPHVDATGPGWVKVDAAQQDVFGGKPGFAWYRTKLTGPGNKGMTLHFAGVNDDAIVYVNGRLAGSHNGFGQPFDISISNFWRAGQPNVFAVLINNTQQKGWLGEVDLVRPTGSIAAFGPATPSYDDAAWKPVQLPNDYLVNGTPDKSLSPANAYLPAVVGWYRKTFTFPRADAGKKIYLDFDGVYRDSSVWLNGHLLGTHQSGYTGFEYDATAAIHPGARNVLAVRVDPRLYEGWWYEGGGIYRHVRLTIASPLHVAHWGTFVISTIPGADKTHPKIADLTVQTTLQNSGGASANAKLVSQIVTPSGQTAVSGAMSVRVAAGAQQTFTQHFIVKNPRLWSLDQPNLYRLATKIEQNSRLADNVSTTFGIRTLGFDPAKGFFLNGKHVVIQGTANHQNFAVVGVALPDNLLAWRIAQLKAVGCNGYRTAHDPQATELLDACDKQGMLVMDENRHLGDTYAPKTKSGTPYSDHADLQDLVLRDRNHPSVIMWSMCNEEGLSRTEEGARIFAAMRSAVRKIDPTRPVTCAMLPPWGVGFSNVEDLQGFNHGLDKIDAFRAAFPNKPTFGSEFRGALSDRGVTDNSRALGLRDNYSLDRMAEEAWIPVVKRPYMMGAFVWTGFDYQGESSPYHWPDVNGHFGMFDLTGLPKDGYYYYKANWTSKPMVHIFPHWNWAGKEGQPITVWAYSNCAKVDLLLNGKSLGAQPVLRDTHLVWTVPYAPGTLEAKGYDQSGKLIADDQVQTTGALAKLQLSAYQMPFRPNGEDLALVKITVVDSQGRMVPTASNIVSVTSSGPATLVGTSNGAPNDHVPPHFTTRPVFNGIEVAALRASTDSGKVTVTVTSPGLTPATLALQVK